MRSRSLLLTFAFGFGFGLTFSVVFFLKSSRHETADCSDTGHQNHPLVNPGNFVPNNPQRAHREWENLLRIMNDKTASHKDWGDQHAHEGEDLLSSQLYKSVKIFCWIMTSPDGLKKKAIHVKATWAKRCNGYVFMSSKADPSFPAIGLGVSEGRGHLWGKTKAAFRYIYDHHLQQYDFFLKADDDSFVIVENARYLLKDYNASLPYYTGRRFKVYVRQGYMSGGAGYVLSREAVRLFIEKAVSGSVGGKCRQDEGGAEDVNMGACLEAVGTKIIDSVDSLGREKFHPFPPESHLNEGHIPKNNWLWQYSYFPLKTGSECCSDSTISFHYISPSFMYVMEFFIYHIRPYGIVRDASSVKRLLLKQIMEELNLHKNVSTSL